MTRVPLSWIALHEVSTPNLHQGLARLDHAQHHLSETRKARNLGEKPEDRDRYRMLLAQIGQALQGLQSTLDELKVLECD